MVASPDGPHRGATRVYRAMATRMTFDLNDKRYEPERTSLIDAVRNGHDSIARSFANIIKARAKEAGLLNGADTADVLDAARRPGERKPKPAKTVTETPAVTSVAALMQQSFPPLCWAVDDLIPEGTI